MMSPNASKRFAELSSFIQDNGLFSAGSKLSQTVLLQLYRHLAAGQPVKVNSLALKLELEVTRVKSVLNQVPPSNIVWDQDNNITAYRGLDIHRSRHRIIVNDKTLYTWCAFDCLFMPQLLNCRAEVFSTCPETGSKIHFRLDRQGNSNSLAPALFMSFVRPDIGDYAGDLRGSFCQHVNFFTCENAGITWTDRNTGTVLITLDEALELAKIRNKTGFGKVLT